MRKFIIYFFLIFFISSCNKKNKSNNCIEIEFSYNELQKTYFLEDLIDTIWEVNLETNDNCLFSYALYTLVQDSFIYLLDMKQNIIFIFNLNNGKFVKKNRSKREGSGRIFKYRIYIYQSRKTTSSL